MKRSELEVFVTDLTIRKKQVGLVRNSQDKMIGILLPGDKITRQVALARMAGAANIEHLLARQLQPGGSAIFSTLD